MILNVIKIKLKHNIQVNLIFQFDVLILKQNIIDKLYKIVILLPYFDKILFLRIFNNISI